MENRDYNQKGYTLIELLVYLGIVTISVMVFTVFVVNVTKNSARAEMKQELQENARVVINRLTQNIRQAQSVGLAGGILTLNQGASVVTFQLDPVKNTVVYTDSTGPHDLTSDKVKVNAMTFTNTPGSGLVKIELTFVQSNDPSQSFSLKTAALARQSIY